MVEPQESQESQINLTQHKPEELISALLQKLNTDPDSFSQTTLTLLQNLVGLCEKKDNRTMWAKRLYKETIAFDRMYVHPTSKQYEFDSKVFPNPTLPQTTAAKKFFPGEHMIADGLDADYGSPNQKTPVLTIAHGEIDNEDVAFIYFYNVAEDDFRGGVVKFQAVLTPQGGKDLETAIFSGNFDPSSIFDAYEKFFYPDERQRLGTRKIRSTKPEYVETKMKVIVCDKKGKEFRNRRKTTLEIPET